jgi:hypothetical protein
MNSEVHQAPSFPTWEKALRDETTFGELVTPSVRLERSIFSAAISGREKVWSAIQRGDW